MSLSADNTIFVTSSDGNSVGVRKIGGRSYPLYRNPHCKTCSSPYRDEIESAILKSYGWTAIANSLPPDAALSDDNIRKHYDSGHMPLDEMARRVLIEEYAKEMGLDPSRHEGMLADHVVFAKIGIQKVFQRMMAGELEPDMDHGIAFANFLLKVEERAGKGYETEAVAKGFMAYLDAIRLVCTPEQMGEIMMLIKKNPVMGALASRPMDDDDVIDGESEEVDPEG